MKRYILAAVLQLLVLTAMAAKVEDLYLLYNRGDGSKLYYIREQKMTPLGKESGKLTYDITYIDTDSIATWRLSVVVPTVLQIDSIGFQQGDANYTVPCKTLYIEPQKKNWEHRIESALPYTTTRSLFTPEPGLHIVIYHQDGVRTFAITSQKDRASLCASMRDIFRIIEVNRK